MLLILTPPPFYVKCFEREIWADVGGSLGYLGEIGGNGGFWNVWAKGFAGEGRVRGNADGAVVVGCRLFGVALHQKGNAAFDALAGASFVVSSQCMHLLPLRWKPATDLYFITVFM